MNTTLDWFQPINLKFSQLFFRRQLAFQLPKYYYLPIVWRKPDGWIPVFGWSQSRNLRPLRLQLLIWLWRHPKKKRKKTREEHASLRKIFLIQILVLKPSPKPEPKHAAEAKPNKYGTAPQPNLPDGGQGGIFGSSQEIFLLLTIQDQAPGQARLIGVSAVFLYCFQKDNAS